MSTANGNPTPHKPVAPSVDVKTARQKTKELRAANALKLAEIEAKMLESSPWFYDFDTDDLFARMRSPDGAQWTPLATPQDRRAGSLWPMWRTQQELDSLRQISRVLCATNDYAKGLLRNLTNYVIGKGGTYKCGSKDKTEKPSQDDGDSPGAKRAAFIDQLCDATQNVVDKFLSLNRWNSCGDPQADKAATGPTREKESYRRTQRDGDTLIRFHRQENGTVFIRFVEPECLRNPPGGIPQNGWSFGIRHQIHPYEDLESIEAYHFVYQDPSIRNEQETEEPFGEIVDAIDVVHIKRPDEDAATKRGTPAFAFDCAEALMRAAKLQRNMSTAASVRAATAEIWQHAYGTQTQIQSLAQGMPTAFQRNDPVSQQSVNHERILPGQIRRVPMGQSVVPPAASTGVPEHIQAQQGDLQQSCTAFSAPQYFTGDASNANYASTSESGTPFVRSAESEQSHYEAAFLVCVWKAVKWAVECGVLPREVLTEIEIQVELPLVHKNNELELSQVRASDLTQKVLSPQTAMMEMGRDPEVEMANIMEWQEKMGQQGAPLPMPDDDGKVPSSMPTPESRLWENFTGTIIDKAGRKITYQDGKRVAGQHDAPAGDSRKKSGTTKAAGRVPEGKSSEKADRAKAAHKMVNKDIQRYAEEHNEPRFAKVVDGVSHPDSEPMDVTAKNGDLIEMKTMVDNSNNKITMDSYSQVRKIVKEQEVGKQFHTVVSDDHKIYNANGDGKHGDDKDRVYYYRRGVAGSARIGSMYKCRDEAELKKLMTMPEEKLPPAAQRTDGKLRVGKWKFFQDEQGKGYKNTKTGQIVRAKK